MELPLRVLSVDAAIFDGRGALLLIERNCEPLGWALPGGMVELDETAEQAVLREVQEETNAIWPTGFELRMFRVLTAPGRDPRGPTASIAFTGLVTDRVIVRGGDDAKKAEWRADWEKLPLAFDHAEIARLAWEATGLKRGPIKPQPAFPFVLIPKEPPSLTFKQTATLKDLYGGLGAHKAETNPTLKALQKKGCVVLQQHNDPAGRVKSFWTITELGRSAISA